MALSMSANPHLPSISVGREGVIVFRTSCPGTGTRATLCPSQNGILSRRGMSGVSECVGPIVLVFFDIEERIV
jgi:hypothetical protein